MSKPEKEQNIRPEEKLTSKEDGGATKIILMNIVTTAVVCIIFLGAFFVMQKTMFASNPQANQEEVLSEEDESADDEVEKGIILDLGEFTMNLADTNQKRYLKVAVALEVTKTEEDLAATAQPAEGEKHGHGEGGGGEELEKKLVAEMEHYKPAIRDAVITTLTSKVADEVSTSTGKELAKDQIKEAVDAIFAGEREVIRVSFGEFIIQ